MKTFEITSPELKQVGDALLDVIISRKAGTMEKDEARDIISAGNVFVRVAGQDLKARLSMARVGAMEAKLIGGEAARQIKAP